MPDQIPPLVPPVDPYQTPPADRPTQPVHPVQPTYVYPYSGFSGHAIASLVLALTGIGLGAVIAGHIALKRIKEQNKEGRTMALWGLWLGYIQSALWILVIITVIAGASGTSSANIDKLHNDCASGDLYACDVLWTETPGGSAEEAFADDCGGHEPQTNSAWCSPLGESEFADTYGGGS